MGSFLWQVFTSPGKWRAGRGTSTSSVLASQHLYSPGVVCAIPCLGGGVLSPHGATPGHGGDISARTPSEACFFSPGSSVNRVAVLRAGRGLAPSHWHSFPPGQRPLLQVSVLGGDTRMGEAWVKPAGPCKGEAPLGWWLSCHLCFPSGPHPKMMEGGCSPPGTSFFSMLQALPTSEEVLAAAAAPPAPHCCSLW